MAGGDASHRSSDDPDTLADAGIVAGHGDRAHQTGPDRSADGPPGGRGHVGPAAQREILAQFEAAIAGMHTRDIQIGLRQLLATPGSAPPNGIPPRVRGNGAACVEHGADGSSGASVAGSTGGAGGVRSAGGVSVTRSAGGVSVTRSAGGVHGTGNAGGVHGTGNANLASGAERADGAAALTVPEPRPGSEPDDLPGPVAELVLAVRTPSARRQMERLISEAELLRVNTVSTDTAARMVRPYTWLLERVGDEGIRLTDAGHLTPGEVAAVIDALGLAGSPSRRESPVRRENQAPAVVQLRESAQATGLVRKQRGRLLLTATGQELRSDPVALWWHLAERMPLRSAAVSEVQPGMILLACVAARFTDTLNVTIARMLSAIGWMNSDGSPLTGAEAAGATSGTHAVLRRLGVLPSEPWPGHVPWPTPEGVAFARAALRTWP